MATKDIEFQPSEAKLAVELQSCKACHKVGTHQLQAHRVVRDPESWQSVLKLSLPQSCTRIVTCLCHGFGIGLA